MALETPDIEEILRSHLKSDDFEILSCESTDTEDVSTGFLSAQDKACISYRTPNRGKGELHVFIKRLPESPYHRGNVVSFGGFHREVVLYNEILNHFLEMLGDDTIPECFLARSDDIVVLEDMAKKGFKNKDLLNTFNLAECEAALVSLAKFHALSFLTEKTRGCKMTELLPVIKTEVIKRNEENFVGKKYLLTGVRALRRVAELHLNHYPAAVMKNAFDCMENVVDELKSSKLYPNVLAHADLWANNVMFKYGESGEVEAACLFDFQLATYKPPSYDILILMHTSTESVFREKHHDHLMRHYYTALSKQLSSFGIDVEDVLSWSDFEGMLEETLPLALMEACFFLHFVLMPEDILKDIMHSVSKYKVFYEQDRTDIVLKAVEGKKEYRDRILTALANLLDYFHTKQQ